MNSSPKWRRFEKLVARVQQELAPNATVTHDDRIKGYDSEEFRQVDVSVKQKIGQYDMLIAIDCKDYKVPVDVKDVEEFVGLVRDIRANKGVMVARNGFTETARRVGEKAALDLLRLIDTDEHEWKAIVTVPVICDFRQLRSYQLRFDFTSGECPKGWKVPLDPRKLPLYNQKYSLLGEVFQLLKLRWNNGELPRERGCYYGIALAQEPTFVLHDGQFYQLAATANILIEHRLFFGWLPLDEVHGFADELSGEVITRGFTTGWLNFEEIERTWRRLQKKDDVAITPIFTLQALDVAE